MIKVFSPNCLSKPVQPKLFVASPVAQSVAYGTWEQGVACSIHGSAKFMTQIDIRHRCLNYLEKENIKRGFANRILVNCPLNSKSTERLIQANPETLQLFFKDTSILVFIQFSTILIL